MTDGKSTILIVEDSEDIRSALRLMLKLHDFNVCEAGDGESAIRQAIGIQPDMILMDVTLPGIDGIEATRAIRGQENCEDIPLIIISAHDGEDVSERARAAGATDFCSKPIEFSYLITLINKHLHLS
ncbi:MAG: response regulator [Blastocatellales bacterium]